MDLVNGVAEPRVKGKEADDFRKLLQPDIDKAKKNGWTIEIPFEIPDIDEE